MTRSVMFVLPSFAGGGAERVMAQLAARLDPARFAPTLLTMAAEGPVGRHIPDTLRIIDLKRPRLRAALPALIATIRRERPDVVVSTFGYVNLALLVARRLLPSGTRLIIRDANMPSLSLPQVRFGRLMRLGYRTLYRHAHRVVCTSRLMAEDFIRNFRVPGDRITIVPNPVDTIGIRKAAMPPLRLDGKGQRFVAAGRLTRQKGFDRLLDAMARMPETARLTLLGDGPQREALKEAALRLDIADRIEMMGYTSDPWPHYAGADAFLLPSRWEGMPNAALEALACGTLVIATPEAGAIGEVAAAAPAGAVSIAEAGNDFEAAMLAVRPRPVAKPRKSLLPSEFEIDRVVVQFEDLLAQ